MPALFVIAHAPLASALHAAARHAYPELAEGLASYDVRPDASPEQTAREVVQTLESLGDGDVLVLADVFGATPCNIARGVCDGRRNLRVAVGVNVPMLWRAINHRDRPLDELLALALEGARNGIMPVAVTRPQNQGRQAAGHDQAQRHDQ